MILATLHSYVRAVVDEWMGGLLCVCGIMAKVKHWKIENIGEKYFDCFKGKPFHYFDIVPFMEHFRFPNGKKVSCGAHMMGDQTAAAPLDPNEERLSITQIINHPNYNEVTFDNDIAVIKVNGNFTCGTNIFPACLPNRDVRSSSWVSTEIL